MPEWLGYELLRELGEPEVGGEDLALEGLAVVGGVDSPGPAFVPFPSDPSRPLFVVPLAQLGGLSGLRFVQPILGRRRSGVGNLLDLEDRVSTGEPWSPGLAKAALAPPAAPATEEEGPRPQLPFEEILTEAGIGARLALALAQEAAPSDAPPVRVAVIDQRFDGWGALAGADPSCFDRPYGQPLNFPRASRPPPRAPGFLGHGAVLARVVERIAPGVSLGLFEVPRLGDGLADPTDLAAAIGRAAWSWGAEVILLPLAEGAWGTPPHLLEAVRQAARGGRGGRGTPVVCATNRISANAFHSTPSAAMSLDDLCNQPLVIAVGASDRRGGWYRRGEPVSRLGPAVEVTAPGDALIVVEETGQIADDSSLASALIAGTLALLLRAAPELTEGQLRQLLRLTARRHPPDPPGAGPLASRLNERDRTGHNLKVGYGKVRADHALRAAVDPVCQALLSTRDEDEGDEPLLSRIFAAWDLALEQGRHHPLVAAYLRCRPALARQLLQDRELEDALAFLARHLRALARHRTALWPGAGQPHDALDARVIGLGELLLASEAKAFGEALIAQVRAHPGRAAHWLAGATGLAEDRR